MSLGINDSSEISLEGKLAAYLATKGGPRSVKVSNLVQFTLGASRSTYGFDAEGEDAEGKEHRDEMVLRLDPPDQEGSLVPSNMAGEFSWYRAFFREGSVPVPEPLFCETDPAILGAPFMVMRRLSGYTDWETIFEPRFDSARQDICAEAFRILGRIAAVDVDKIVLNPDLRSRTTPDSAWAEQLDYWDAILLDHELGPMPITRAAVRRLRANPPPPAPRVSVVEGDFRLGNYLYLTSGVVGILDWEMAHLGDPHEDVAWTSLPNWGTRDKSRIWSVVDDRAAMYRAWEEASGLTINQESLAWWTLLCHVKAAALWLKGASSLVRGHADQIRYVNMNWFSTPQQEQWMLEAMEAVGR
jgi:aminoglycoside phosphotransferase (APT) family kinase protein